MALTLAEAAKLSNDVVQAGVIETIVKESPVLQWLPFISITGNALTYNRESTLPSAAFYAVGDTWSESTPTFTQVTASLKILGGDADVDNYIRQTRQNVQDIEAVVLQLKAKAVAHTFEQAFFYGDSTVDANSFDGLQKLCSPGQRLNQGSGTTPAALSLAKLDQLIDLIRPGRPDLLLMSRRTRRGLSQYARASQSPVTYQPTQFGLQQMFYNEIPIGVCDFISDTESLSGGAFASATGGTATSIFAVKFGEGRLAGLENGGIQVERVGTLETKDATRNRVKWYCGLALFSTLSLAVLDGISSAAVVE